MAPRRTTRKPWHRQGCVDLTSCLFCPKPLVHLDNMYIFTSIYVCVYIYIYMYAYIHTYMYMTLEEEGLDQSFLCGPRPCPKHGLVRIFHSFLCCLVEPMASVLCFCPFASFAADGVAL